MTQNQPSGQRVKRPLWFVILGAIVGGVLVAGIIAFAEYHFFYIVLLFSALMGLAGGVFAWMIAEAVNQQVTWRAAILGAALGLFIFLSYRYIGYLFVLNEIDLSLSFWEYTELRALTGSTLFRLTNEAAGLTLNTTLTWALWLFEAGIAVFCGGYLGKTMDIKV